MRKDRGGPAFGAMAAIALLRCGYVITGLD
jgi:hypothetical protein